MLENPAYYIIGGGGHASVLLSILKLNGCLIGGFFDMSQDTQLSRLGVKYLGRGHEDQEFPSTKLFVNGIGGASNTITRRMIFETYTNRGAIFPAIIHRHSFVASEAVIQNGVQVMLGALIQPGATIGTNSIVNTGAKIDHDCSIGAHVHIAPGATLSGNVKVKEGAHVGTNATIIQGIEIGENAVVGAGSVVIRHVRPHTVVFGNPAKEKGSK